MAATLNINFIIIISSILCYHNRLLIFCIGLELKQRIFFCCDEKKSCIRLFHINFVLNSIYITLYRTHSLHLFYNHVCCKTHLLFILSTNAMGTNFWRRLFMCNFKNVVTVYAAHAISLYLLTFHHLVLFSFYFIHLFICHPHILLNTVLSAFWQSLIKYMMMMMMFWNIKIRKVGYRYAWQKPCDYSWRLDGTVQWHVRSC